MNAEDSLQEGIDYYVENGWLVFTAHYLLERGYCCKSGCRHCPYGFVKEPNRNNSIAQDTASSEIKS